MSELVIQELSSGRILAIEESSWSGVLDAQKGLEFMQTPTTLYQFNARVPGLNVDGYGFYYRGFITPGVVEYVECQDVTLGEPTKQKPISEYARVINDYTENS